MFWEVILYSRSKSVETLDAIFDGAILIYLPIQWPMLKQCFLTYVRFLPSIPGANYK